MAARTKTNGRVNGATTHLAADGLQDIAATFTSTAGTLSRLAQEVSDGAELQTRSLDEALSGVNEMSASLKETATQSGSVAMWALISVGLFHSIMFPTIFTLGIKGLGPLTEEASGLLIMAIAGGALVIVQGWLADRYGLQASFFLTFACEIYTLFYALWGSRTAPDVEGAHT